MTTATKKRVSKAAGVKQAKKAKREELVSQLAPMALLGEIITWNARSETTHTLQGVVQALTDADLDTEYAKELLPRFAFSRACKEMEEEAIIDVVKDEGSDIKFQFTRKTMRNEEWKYTKDTELTLNKDTGKITCAKVDLEQVAQRLLDSAMLARTTADITKIVQRLFEKNGDLFSLREQGGVYFVPQEFTPFIQKIQRFLEALGGSVSRFPVPAGTQNGDKAVQDAVADAMLGLVKDHKLATKQFTINTRRDTMEHQADKIKQTRIKAQAYANYLQDRASEVLAAINAADKELVEQINKVSEAKASNPNKPVGLFGHSMTAVIRWMGANKWSFAEAKKVLAVNKQQASDNTVRWQLAAGKKGDPAPAVLSKEEAKTLEDQKGAA